MKFNNLEDVLNYIENKTNFQLGLLRVEAFLKKAKIAHEKLKYIHIGGTNGKGSTAYYLANILIRSNYKTGMFSSPSIESHNDRIRINNEFISDQAIIDFVNEYYDIIEETEVTMFEIDVLMALDYFVKNEVDYVIMEVGMGGRYDGTNVITPLVSLITNIGLDHQKYLGESIEEIAENKAGIIKPNVPIITSERDLTSLKILEDEALKNNSLFIETTTPTIKSELPIIFNYKDYENIELYSLANYQIKNACLVLETCDYLKKECGLNLSDEVIKDVFKTVTWSGRFEVISTNPLVILDGAHNREGIAELTLTLNKFSAYQKTILFAALDDKATDDMVQSLIETDSDVVITEFDFYRTKAAQEINRNFDLEVTLDFKEYIKNKMDMMSNSEMFIITGSLYFISEVRKILVG